MTITNLSGAGLQSMMPLLRLCLALLVSGLLVACGGGGKSPDSARDRAKPGEYLSIVGSSTLSPFVTTAAEYFRATTDFPVPVIETTGTGGGLKIFCQSNAFDSPSIAMASRRITTGESEACRRNGVNGLLELKFGYDGIVLINAVGSTQFELTRRQLYLALAKDIPVNGRLTENPKRYWNEISPNLPEQKIEVFGPPPTSGTRDAFVQLVLEAGALTFPDMAGLSRSDPDKFMELAHTLRTDGGWTNAGENDSQIVLSLIRNPQALGIVGFSFLEQSSDRIQAAPIDGVRPEFSSIESGDYTVSRALYLYMKEEHFGHVASLAPFIRELYSDAAMGPLGYLSDKGLVPLSPAERASVLARFEDANIAQTTGETSTSPG